MNFFLEKNNVLKTFILLSILYALSISFTKVTFTLFLLDKGFTKLENNFIFSTFNFSVILLEPLTAPIAELFSKKSSFIIGCILKIITALLFIFSTNIFGMVVAEIVSGLAAAFISGCLTAWFFDHIKNNSELSEKGYKVFSLVSRFKSLFVILGGLSGSYLGNNNLNNPWIANMLFFSLLIIIAKYVMPNDENYEIKEKKKDYKLKTLFNNYKNILSDRFISFLLSSSLVSGMGLISLQMFRLPMIKEDFKISTFYVGIIWVIIESARIFGTFFVNKYYDSFKIPIQGLIYLPILSFFLLVGAKFFSGSFLMIIFFFIFEFFSPFYSCLKEYLLGQRVLSLGRVTILSLENSIDKIGDVIGLILIGWIADSFSIEIAWYISAFIFSTSSILYYFAYKEQKNQNLINLERV